MSQLSALRTNIYGTYISNTNLHNTINFLTHYNYYKSNYICLPNVYVVVQAYNNLLLKNILNNSLLTLADGKPLELYAKIKGAQDISTISGYWLIKALLTTDLKHYFYGADRITLETMISRLQIEYPNARIIGYKSPPFLDSNEIKYNQTIIQDINIMKKLKPDIIWIGISSPKQDILMNEYYKDLDYGLMIGVGAVFDYLSGRVKKSPEWMKKLCLRWLYRLVKEPERLWKRYLISNSVFIFLLIKEICLTMFYALTKQVKSLK